MEVVIDFDGEFQNDYNGASQIANETSYLQHRRHSLCSRYQGEESGSLFTG